MKTCLAALLVLVVAAPALASICAFDAAPAATLLFPFVVFDYNNPLDGDTTLISITNMSPEAQIVHVTLWTDTGFGLSEAFTLASACERGTFAEWPPASVARPYKPWCRG